MTKYNSINRCSGTNFETVKDIQVLEQC